MTRYEQMQEEMRRNASADINTLAKAVMLSGPTEDYCKNDCAGDVDNPLEQCLPCCVRWLNEEL